ncbi:hypothetical protein [Blastococcus montanus]|uniref:hypothetical protein n=1 Tax=Blastococcus montanus TaxID=3144973 RepID=UPI003208F0C9
MLPAMYLETLENGHRKPTKGFLRAAALMSRAPMPDVLVALLYRPELGGGPLLDLAGATMRGPSFWTAAEHESLALQTARIHRCNYCVDIHTELVTIASRGAMDPDDVASHRPELRGVIGLLEACHTEGGDVGGALRRTRAVPVPLDAIHHAMTVHLVWDAVNRLAHAYGFELQGAQLHLGTRALHLSGYRLPGFLTGHTDSSGADGDAPFSARIDALRRAPLHAPAHASLDLRTAALAGEPLPEPWSGYAEKIRRTPSRLGVDDVRRLTAAGASEEEIIELTTATAIGAAIHIFDDVEREMTALEAPS